MANKKFKDLDLSNGFLFSAALADSDTCQIVLELILGRPVGKLRVHAEHSILFNSDFRSVRLDIYAEEGGELEVKHDLEMQSKETGTLQQRVRFYQAELDVGSLKPGEDYHFLKPTCIVFICNFDPFGEKCYRYTLEKRWKETGQLYEDGAQVLFLSTKGENADEVPVELVHFLKYLEHSTEEVAESSADNRIRQLHEKLKVLKDSRKLERKFMTIEELFGTSKEEIREEAKTTYLISVVQKLLKRHDIVQIAEELEESEESLRPIYEAIQKCGISADPEEIYEEIRGSQETI